VADVPNRLSLTPPEEIMFQFAHYMSR
jgi:hypothetical protein